MSVYHKTRVQRSLLRCLCVYLHDFGGIGWFLHAVTPLQPLHKRLVDLYSWIWTSPCTNKYFYVTFFRTQLISVITTKTITIKQSYNHVSFVQFSLIWLSCGQYVLRGKNLDTRVPCILRCLTNLHVSLIQPKPWEPKCADK